MATNGYANDDDRLPKVNLLVANGYTKVKWLLKVNLWLQMVMLSMRND